MNAFDGLVGCYLDADGFLVANREEFDGEGEEVILELDKFSLENFICERLLGYCVLLVAVLVHFLYWLGPCFQGIFLGDETEENGQPFSGRSECKSEILEKFLRADDGISFGRRQSLRRIGLVVIFCEQLNMVGVGSVPEFKERSLSIFFLNILIVFEMLLKGDSGEFLHDIDILIVKEGLEVVEDVEDDGFEVIGLMEEYFFQLPKAEVILITVEIEFIFFQEF